MGAGLTIRRAATTASSPALRGSTHTPSASPALATRCYAPNRRVRRNSLPMHARAAVAVPLRSVCRMPRECVRACVFVCVSARPWLPCSSCVCHGACHHSHRFHAPSLFPSLRNAFRLLCWPSLSLCRCAPRALRLAPGVSDGHGGASCRQPSPPITACSTGNKLTTPPPLPCRRRQTPSSNLRSSCRFLSWWLHRWFAMLPIGYYQRAPFGV